MRRGSAEVRKKAPVRRAARELGRHASALLLCFALTTSLIAADLSESKYVIAPAPYTISMSSSDTIDITALGAVSGTTQVGQTLTAGALTPSDATATYQWQRSTASNGTYTDIVGAVSNTYVIPASYVNNYFRVVATGSGTYHGTFTSEYVGPASRCPVAAISAINGMTEVGQTLTAGTVTPAGATVTYQWRRCATPNGTYANITGATASTYTLTEDDVNYYIRVRIAGTGGYIGNVTSAFLGPCVTNAATITAIGAISGTDQVGHTLAAGAMTPAGATVTYQWQRCDTSDGTYEDIAGSNSSTYAILVSDLNYYIRVVATGIGAYQGTVTSNFKGPVETCPITAIGAISGSTVVGEVLTVGTLTPFGATVNYQWQRCASSDGTYEDIVGATADTYTLLAEDNSYYIKVAVTGTGGYSGNVTSLFTGQVSNIATPITAIGAISGTAQVEQTLAAGALTPAGATVTYQWQRCSTFDGIYEDIAGATSSSYDIPPSDVNYYIRLVAAGAGNYEGTVTSDYVGPVSRCPVTSVGAISGITEVGQTLIAGAVTPEGATVSYQWRRCATPNGTYTNIGGATLSTYTLTELDLNYYFRVRVTGTAGYTGVVNSAYTGPCVTEATVITAIGVISGSAQVGQTLTAGVLTPADATVVYQWQRCDAPDGTYVDIVGATSSNYTLLTSDLGYYFRVSATGSGVYAGRVDSEFVGPAASCSITAIGAINGIAVVGQILTAGTLTPAEATATYQWQKCATSHGTYEDITGATSGTYTVLAEDSNYYLKVIATGTGSYAAAVSSPFTGPVNETAAPLTAIDAMSGTVQVGQTLTVGALTPAGATATYQWQRCATLSGTYEDISGATHNSYTLLASDVNYYFKVVATGSGLFQGSVTSSSAGPAAACPITAIGAIIGTPEVGQLLTAGGITPEGASVSYQWRRSLTPSGGYANITGATSSTYTIAESDLNYYFRVRVTGINGYSGTLNSAYTGPVTAVSGFSEGMFIEPDGLTITAIGEITGTPEVYQTLTAGVLTPADAAATYQWQRSTAIDGTFEEIAEATSTTYILTAQDVGYYLRVVATGSGDYSGSISSAVIGPVTAAPVTISSIEISAPAVDGIPQSEITATTEYTAVISWSPAHSVFEAGVTYTATVNITVNPGYTFDGIPADFFTVAGAVSSTNAPGSGIITVVFPSL